MPLALRVLPLLPAKALSIHEVTSPVKKVREGLLLTFVLYGNGYAGKTGNKDKRRFYSIARGSALECAALLDLCTVWHLVDPSLITEARACLEQVAAMLGRLCTDRSQGAGTGAGTGAVPVPGAG